MASVRFLRSEKGTSDSALVYTEGVEAYYANIVSYRVTADELVLEFGCFFPGQDGRSQPSPQDTAVRVVMSANAVEQFQAALSIAREARDKHRNEAARQTVRKEGPSQ